MLLASASDGSTWHSAACHMPVTIAAPPSRVGHFFCDAVTRTAALSPSAALRAAAAPRARRALLASCLRSRISLLKGRGDQIHPRPPPLWSPMPSPVRGRVAEGREGAARHRSLPLTPPCRERGTRHISFHNGIRYAVAARAASEAPRSLRRARLYRAHAMLELIRQRRLERQISLLIG